MTRQFIKDVGFEYIHNNKSLIVQLLSVTKENVHFDEKDLKNMIRITSNYFDSITNNKITDTELFGKLQVEEYDLDINGLSFYKFISKETYANFLKKGKFQLGSLKRYREIENPNSRDEKEGFSNLLIKSGNRSIFTSVIAGFNHYIFCGTDSIDESLLMSKKFGDICIKIKNVRSFAEKIKKSIGAKSWTIKKVIYSDFKSYSANQEITDLKGVSPDLSEEFFNYLIRFSFLPSIFCKPTRFSTENELRLTFEMDKNVQKKMNFDNLGLLDQIEIIKNYG
jgi:hypothetical protein